MQSTWLLNLDQFTIDIWFLREEKWFIGQACLHSPIKVKSHIAVCLSLRFAQCLILFGPLYLCDIFQCVVMTYCKSICIIYLFDLLLLVLSAIWYADQVQAMWSTGTSMRDRNWRPEGGWMGADQNFFEIWNVGLCPKITASPRT